MGLTPQFFHLFNVLMVDIKMRKMDLDIQPQ